MAKILVLEDEVNLVDLLKMLLQFEGYEVKVPAEFDRILEIVDNFSPDGMIMDVALQDIDGLEIVEEIRKMEKFASVYNLAFSGFDHSHSAIEKGASDFLLKPFMPDEIVNLLNQNLN